MAHWYFAYGANMRGEVLRRRRVQPLSSEASWVRDYELVFEEPGIPLIEPAFASVRARPGAVVHGVLHRLSAPDMERLDGYEGSGYQRVTVTARGARSGEVEAGLYLARSPRAGLRPSRRYLRHLIEGAREHGLPTSWVARLESQRCAHVPLVHAAVPRLIVGMEALQRRSPRFRRWMDRVWERLG